MRLVAELAGAEEGALESADRAAVEAVQAVRTVHSFNLQSRVVAAYADIVNAPAARMQRQGFVSGLTFGIGQMILFLFFALAFWCAQANHPCSHWEHLCEDDDLRHICVNSPHKL